MFEHTEAKKKVRIRIKSDAYEFQSYAVAEVWKDDEWNRVCDVHYSNMATEHGLIYRKGYDDPACVSDIVVATNFRTDRSMLLELVSLMLE